MIFFAAAAANQNDLVAIEAKNAGSSDIQITGSGVEFHGDLETAYRFCLNSRIATRLMLGIAEDEHIYGDSDFYDASLQIPWEEYLDPTKSFSVTVTSINVPWLKRNTFAAIRLKDAIVDRLREKFDQERPNVEFEDPDITFHVHFDNNRVYWYIDFSGRSLHKRGYRQEATDAVLKENLACATLMRSDWYKTVLDGDPALLLDPFCGSGTLPIEAALIATDTAPGLLNPNRFAFLKLDLHDSTLWEELLEEAYERQKIGKTRNIKIIGWDTDNDAIEISVQHAINAQVEQFITFEQKDFTKIEEEDIPQGENYVVTDPPYGIRLENSSIVNLYHAMGEKFNTLFPGWKVAILCGNQELLGYVDMKPNRTNSLFNGPIEAQLAHYYVFTKEEKQELIEKAIERKRERLARPLSEGAQMAFNRLKKNLARLQPLMEEQQVSSYRIYDADMPEYSAAIDFYENRFIHLQEYAAPSSVNEEDAQKRLQDLIDATERATKVELEHIFIKQRKEQKGLNQYEKLSSKGKFYIMRENGLMFLVNFSDYLDTGIFLDHRPIRKYIQENAKDKRFLNLFCYTGTATVHAASGKAASTVSVDASSTYLDWAIKNMEMNGFDQMNHFYFKDDCIQWLKNTHDKYDLIFCDPPTFSNSKMRRTFDVDRDQRFLIHQCMRHLNHEGTLIFSTNFRKFRLHSELIETYDVEDITAQTIGLDFERDQKIHYCYLIKHRKAIVKMQTKELEKTTKRIIRKK
jgi:23S rRNA (guanine2445-N2)-methyltransferase / 23S rRNA (guanine2069-N7)-methyltransferase